MPQCPTCGSAVTEGDAICPDCGMDLIEETGAGASAAPVQLQFVEAPPVTEAPQPPAEAPADPLVADAAEAPAGPAIEADAVEVEAPEVEAAQTEGPDAETVEAGGAEAAEVEAAGDTAPEPDAGPVEAPAEVAPPVAGVASARITLRRGGTTTSEVFALGPRAVLGRFDPETGPVDVDLAQLPEAVYVSRRHAEIWQDVTGTWLIKDLGSANGTFVREADATGFHKIGDEQPVADGYEIGLGNARFEFRVAQ